jgi:hypothetical protein
MSDDPWYEKYDMLVGQARSSLDANFPVTVELLFKAQSTPPQGQAENR